MQVILVGASNPHVERLIYRVIVADPRLSIVGFIDDDPDKWGTMFAGYPVLGGLDISPKTASAFVNLISGSCKVRYETSRRLAGNGCRFTNLIDPSVDMNGVTAGTCLYIQEGAHIQQSAVIGDNVSIHMAALIAHEDVIGNSCFIAHAVSLSGCVTLEDGVYVRTNATVLPRVTLGKWSIIGAGSVVTKNVPPYTVVAGNPAKVIRELEHEYESGAIR